LAAEITQYLDDVEGVARPVSQAKTNAALKRTTQC
jgi:hypothetical protein